MTFVTWMSSLPEFDLAPKNSKTIMDEQKGATQSLHRLLSQEVCIGGADNFGPCFF